eukprot:1156442-Pelagomonas_calceolata.AAC.3
MGADPDDGACMASQQTQAWMVMHGTTTNTGLDDDAWRHNTHKLDDDAWHHNRYRLGWELS